jgi:hypothetical protein
VGGTVHPRQAGWNATEKRKARRCESPGLFDFLDVDQIDVVQIEAVQIEAVQTEV